MKDTLMKVGLAALVAGSLVTPLRVSAAPDEALAKCGVPPLIHLVDGRVGDADLFNLVDPQTVTAIIVTCTDVRHLIFGVEVGRQLVVLRSKAPPPPELEATMNAVASLQAAHFLKHQTYARTLAELGWSGTTKVSLCVSADRLRWTLHAASETGGSLSSGGRPPYSDESRSGRVSCDVRYPGAEDILHWVEGEKLIVLTRSYGLHGRPSPSVAWPHLCGFPPLRTKRSRNAEPRR